MILSQGSTEYFDAKKRIIHYHFFDDKEHGGRDAIFGLDIPLMKLANIFKSAARGYGTEQRVILLHGPVGSSKSTIARLLKRGLEAYTARPEGAIVVGDVTGHGMASAMVAAGMASAFRSLRAAGTSDAVCAAGTYCVQDS